LLRSVSRPRPALHKGRISLRCRVTFIYNLCALFTYTIQCEVRVSKYVSKWFPTDKTVSLYIHVICSNLHALSWVITWMYCVCVCVCVCVCMCVTIARYNNKRYITTVSCGCHLSPVYYVVPLVASSRETKKCLSTMFVYLRYILALSEKLKKINKTWQCYHLYNPYKWIR